MRPFSKSSTVAERPMPDVVDRDAERTPDSYRRVSVKGEIARKSGGRAGGPLAIRWDLLDAPEMFELCDIVEAEAQTAMGFRVDLVSPERRDRFEALVGKAVGKPHLFQEERDLAAIQKMASQVQREAQPPRRALLEPGSVLLAREWCFDDLRAGFLWPAHVAVLTYILAIFANGELPVPTPGASFEDGVLTLDGRRGRLLPDPEDNFENESRLLDHLESQEFIEVDRRGKVLRITPGSRLMNATKAAA